MDLRGWSNTTGPVRSCRSVGVLTVLSLERNFVLLFVFVLFGEAWRPSARLFRRWIELPIGIQFYSQPAAACCWGLWWGGVGRERKKKIQCQLMTLTCLEEEEEEEKGKNDGKHNQMCTECEVRWGEVRGIDVEPNRRHEAFTYVCVCVDSLFLSKGNFKGEEEGGGFTTEE